ncbi:MAG: hypothetical protein QW348_00360 [Ignisphaera sp.]
MAENREKRAGEWPCNCIFCRVFVHPFMRRRKTVESVEEAVAVESLVEQPPTPQEAQKPQIDFNGIKEAVAEHVTLIVDSKLKEFSSRIDAVEEEVKKVREDMVKSIDEVKSALVDIRAAVTEIANPFNVLRTYAQQSSRGAAPKPNQIIENFEKMLAGMLKNAPQESSESGENQGAASVEDIEAMSKQVVLKGYKKLGLSGLIKLVKWVDDMLNRVPKEVIEEIARFMRAVNAVDEEDERIILSVIEFVYKARKIGLKINEQILHMYNLAKVFGIEDREASEEVLKLTMNSEVG